MNESDWKEQTSEELISQIENERHRILKLKMRDYINPYIVTKKLYDKLKNE
jgi:hypothetical protein